MTAGRPMRLPVPPGARRLFPHYDEAALDPAHGGGSLVVVARLLEDGDSADLVGLTSRISESGLAAWLERHGGRQLSRRSRAFWEVVLGRQAAPPNEARRLLWPF